MLHNQDFLLIPAMTQSKVLDSTLCIFVDGELASLPCYNLYRHSRFFELALLTTACSQEFGIIPDVLRDFIMVPLVSKGDLWCYPSWAWVVDSLASSWPVTLPFSWAGWNAIQGKIGILVWITYDGLIANSWEAPTSPTTRQWYQT